MSPETAFLRAYSPTPIRGRPVLFWRLQPWWLRPGHEPVDPPEGPE